MRTIFFFRMGTISSRFSSAIDWFSLCVGINLPKLREIENFKYKVIDIKQILDVRMFTDHENFCIDCKNGLPDCQAVFDSIMKNANDKRRQVFSSVVIEDETVFYRPARQTLLVEAASARVTH